MRTNDLDLPSNPFNRTPIKRLERLAGRSTQLETITYYLQLTAAGQSPHLALIGSRGSGKTSVLNATDRLARKNQLLAVRVDLNEDKASSNGKLWHDIYWSLVIAAAEVGCWDGIGGTIYSALVQMLTVGHVPNPRLAVLQFPLAAAPNVGSLDRVQCPDALITHDLRTVRTELSLHGIKGIVFLVDEADCLGRSRSALQLMRNVFQRSEGCSLVLAGTEAVFPVISEVFSPIPRQFHRIDIRPFNHWTDTQDLIFKPLKDGPSEILPSTRTIRELHELCGGEPSELQLYCHHIYRHVEDGTLPRMKLHPIVFRDVLSEYRAHTSTDLRAVVKSIEQLGDAILFESRWVRFAKLDLSEAVTRESFLAALKLGRSLDADERHSIEEPVRAGFATLYAAGIIATPDRLDVIGYPFTSGFWKSFVEVEKQKPFVWIQANYQSAMAVEVMLSLFAGLEILPFGSSEDGSSGELLAAIRSGNRPAAVQKHSIAEMMTTTLVGREASRDRAISIDVAIEIGNVTRTFLSDYLGSESIEALRRRFDAWRDSRLSVLVEYGLSVVIRNVVEWQLPTNDEAHRLAWVADFELPVDSFGPSQYELMLTDFAAQNYSSAISRLNALISDKANAIAHNALGYCMVMVDRTAESIAQFARAQELDPDPLWTHNLAVAKWLTGQREEAVGLFRDALARMDRDRDAYERSVVSMLLLSRDGMTVCSEDSITVDAALIVNLAITGGLSVELASGRLTTEFPSQAAELIKRIRDPSGESP